MKMNKMMKSMLLVGTMIVGMGLVTAGCGKSDTASSNGANGQKVYKVATDATYAPFESMVGEKIQGFDIDVLDAIAKQENVKFQYINTNWEGIFLTLPNKERDLVASAVSITDERKKTVDFSDPYFDAKQMIVFKKGAGYKTLNDLKGKKIAVQNGTTGDTVVTNLLGKSSPNIKRFENMPLALMELKNGGVDAAVGDNGVVVEYVKNNGGDGLETAIDSSFQPEQYGFAIRKGDTELQKILNDGIKKIKDDGELAAINKKYGLGQ